MEKNIPLAIYVVALFLGITNSRVATAMSRSGVEPRHLVPAILGFVAMASTFGLVALGFVIYRWWIPVASLIGVGLLVGTVVNRSSLGFFHRINLLVGMGAIALCAYGWWAWAIQ